MTTLESNHTEAAEPRSEPVRTSGGFPVAFQSILFEGVDDRHQAEALEAPDYFRDLNLAQVVDAITANRKEYNLKPFFYHRLTDPTAVAYRQEILRALENETAFQSIKSFAAQMRRMREHLAVADKASYKYEKEAWFLDSAETYCEAVKRLLDDLSAHTPAARGLAAFRTYLAQYVDSDHFKTLTLEAQTLTTGLSAIRYCLLIQGNGITVRNYEAEIDYSTAVEETFAMFRQGTVKDYRAKFAVSSGLNHVEAMVLDRVAQLNPDVFLALDEFYTRNRSYPEKTILDFDREIQFYVAWLEYAETFKRAGLKFCYPQVSNICKEVSSRDGFDLGLAARLIQEGAAVVRNDFDLSGEERMFVVTGPNQGGKTTFARTFGQLHHLASLGCSVPAREARLFLADQICTHFEREENIATLRGKLQDDLFTIHNMLGRATPNSIIIINEIFSSTTLSDSLYLSRNILESITQLDLLCVCVTFLDEIASLNEKTVSVVAEIVSHNPTLRTYRIKRRTANGLAYAAAIAEKYGLTYERLKERLAK